jgi:hypothetical protein
MNRQKMLVLLLLLLLPFMADAQGKSKQVKKKKTKAKTTARAAAPKPPAPQAWMVERNYMVNGGETVYFQDYYTFYDPKRGYVYWNNNRWEASQELPAFMREADLGKARIQILHDRTQAMPEDNFEAYLRQYPAQPVSPTVPVPIITITRDRP